MNTLGGFVPKFRVAFTSGGLSCFLENYFASGGEGKRLELPSQNKLQDGLAVCQQFFTMLNGGMIGKQSE